MRHIGPKAFLVLSVLVSCLNEQELVPEVQPGHEVEFNNQIAPQIWSSPSSQKNLPPLATKALIDAVTTSHIEAQFLRIDEYENSEGKGTYVFPEWDKGYLMEASVISSPSNETQHYRRTVYLNPIQGYRINVSQNPDNPEISDTTFFHTRMISWYPITCPLQKNDKGSAAITQFNYFNSANVGYDAYTVEGNEISVNFHNLDGKTDIMVSEVREGQHWHNQTEPGKHSSDYMPDDVQMTGTSIYREPFGSNETNPVYDNCFKYKHYLSAIKVYAYAEESKQSATMWGRIRHVEVTNQPKSCSVKIPAMTDPVISPDPLGKNKENRNYGTAVYSQTDLTSFELQKNHIFQGDTNGDGEEIAPDNPSLEGTSSTNKLYLGYSLVAPENDIILRIHTDSGIYDVKVPWNYKSAPQKTEKIFQAGYIYNIMLNFGTDGSIAAILLKDAEGVYFDLSTGQTYGDEQNQIFKYKTANSYIVDPRTKYTDKDGKVKYYDGYVFLANVIGNGAEGLRSEFPHKTTDIKPVTAGIIWESTLGLVTNVKYMYDYIRFKVQPPTGPDENFTEGNALIGAYDEAGNLLWSWHIWITDKPGLRVYNTTGQKIGIMDRNLGATEPNTTKDALASYGLYYQWGRKDPSMGPPNENYRPLSTATSEYYDYYGNLLTSTEVVNLAKPTVLDAVKNPMYIILPTAIPEFYPYDWLNKRINTLWGSEELNQKTIYDPCPHGYRVPGTELRTLLVDNIKENTGTNDRAFTMTVADSAGKTDPLYFPLAGYKGVDKGISSLTAAWKYVGEKGDYMYKNVYPNGHRNRIYLSKEQSWKEIGAASGEDGIGKGDCTYNGYVQTDYTNKRTAASVRCIRDDELQFTGLIYPFIRAEETLLLGHNSFLEYGAEAKGNPLTYLKFEARNTRQETPFHVAEPSDVHGINYSATYPIPGQQRPDGIKNYETMGEYTFKVQAKNEMGNVNSIQKTIGVINLTELYDIRFDGVQPDAPDATFTSGELKTMTFRVNMREPLSQTGNINNTSIEDYELLRQYTEVYVNDQWVKASFDPNTGIFTTIEKVKMEDVLKLQCKAKNSKKLLKEYVMTGTETYDYKRLTTVNDMVNGRYYGFSTDQAKPGQELTVWWWYHNGGSTNLSVGNPKDGILHNNNLFKFEEVSGKENRAGYLQLYKTKEYMDSNFGAGNKYYYNFKDSGNQEVRVYRDVEEGNSRSHWGVKYNDGFKWTWPNNVDKATQWFMYEITPKIKYSAPVETVLP